MPIKPKYQTISGEDKDTDADVVKKEALEVIILDFTHSRFSVQLPSPESTILDLKAAGALLHSVNVNQQRLIYQGKMLSDECTLQESGISNGSIVHLFPLPRVVVVNSNTNSADSSNTEEEAQGEESGGRVPTIVMDQDEADRRGQILVLGNAEFVEAVNNVKLFSFMLLIISTIELLNLMAVALGEGGVTANDAIPYAEHDDFFPSDNDDDNTTKDNETSTSDTTNPYQTWTSLSWIDLVVSVLGIYVALLGIRASNENALVVARLYMVGTAITGAGWLVYNFIINFEIDEMEREHRANDPHPSFSNDSVFNEAVQAMVLPAIVWGLCVFRAWQFQHLLAEAEQEAIDRLQSDNEEHDDEEQALQSQGIPIS